MAAFLLGSASLTEQAGEIITTENLGGAALVLLILGRIFDFILKLLDRMRPPANPSKARREEEILEALERLSDRVADVAKRDNP